MVSSTSTASELTREQVIAILVRPLEQRSVFLAAGPRIFDTDGSPVRIPMLTGMTAPSWHGENEKITEVDPDFDEVTLLPSTMKSVKSLTRFSNELARQSVVALDAALRDRMVRDVAAKLDTAFIASTVTDATEPTGLLSYAGVQEVAGAGVPSVDLMYDALGMVLAANVDPNRTRWFMTSRDFINIRKLKDTAGKYLIDNDLANGLTYSLLGRPITVTNRIPQDGGVDGDESSIVLADFSEIAVARDLAPSVKILDQTYGDYDQMAIRVVSRYDAAPLHPQAIVILRGVTPPA